MEVGHDRQGGATTQLEGSPARWTSWETVEMSKKQTVIQVSLGWQEEASRGPEGNMHGLLCSKYQPN